MAMSIRAGPRDAWMHRALQPAARADHLDVAVGGPARVDFRSALVVGSALNALALDSPAECGRHRLGAIADPRPRRKEGLDSVRRGRFQGSTGKVIR
jgi:hypothetical protein